MLTSVYTVEEINQVEDSVDLIKDGTKSMMTLYDQIREVENRARDQIMEANKLNSAASIEIFIDNSMDELVNIEVGCCSETAITRLALNLLLKCLS